MMQALSEAAEATPFLSQRPSHRVLILSLLGFATSTWFLASGNATMALGTALIAGTLLLVAGWSWFATARARREVAAMIRGERFVHWRYDDAIWEAFQMSKEARTRVLWRTLSWILLGISMVVAVITLATQGLIIGLRTLGTASVGLVGLCTFLWLFERWLEGGQLGTGEQASRLGLIGPNGMYFQGTYRPWSTWTSEVTNVNLCQNSSLVELCFTFRESNSDGPDHHFEWYVPVPPGEKRAAEKAIQEVRKLIRER